MYSTPYDRVGMLTAQAWRAARLVVDTGLHALGWTREQAVELLDSVRGGLAGRRRERGGPLHRVAGPGARLQDRLAHDHRAPRAHGRGSARASTLPGFHDEVLRHGALPLALLTECLERWAP